MSFVEAASTWYRLEPYEFRPARSACVSRSCTHLLTRERQWVPPLIRQERPRMVMRNLRKAMNLRRTLVLPIQHERVVDRAETRNLRAPLQRGVRGYRFPLMRWQANKAFSVGSEVEIRSTSLPMINDDRLTMRVLYMVHRGPKETRVPSRGNSRPRRHPSN